MIAVLDLGFGNVASVMNMLKKIRVSACIADNRLAISSANGIILPGVGSFDNCLRLARKDSLLMGELEDKVLSQKVPFLGICVGMQMLFETSDEGIEPGFGWISGQVKKFNFDDNKTKIPHMGWSEVKPENGAEALLDLHTINRFYFVHSYYVECNNKLNSIAFTEYGGKQFTVAVNHENIFGVQFHPEKSHKFGLNLLTKFARLVDV